MTMHDSRIDLSPLDPSRLEPERWDALALSIARRAYERRQRPVTISMQIVHWARPVTALAAAAALVLWGLALIDAQHGTPTASGNDAALAVAAWAESDELPSAREMLITLQETGNGNAR
jgi:hypothetical protein